MIPQEIRNDESLRSWAVMPQGEEHVEHVTEKWERRPHEKDVTAKESSDGKPHYHGEWVDVTAQAKAFWQIKKEELEIEKLRRQERNRRLIDRGLNTEDDADE